MKLAILASGAFSLVLAASAQAETMFDYCGNQEEALRAQVHRLVLPKVPVADLQARNQAVAQKFVAVLAKNPKAQTAIMKYEQAKNPYEKGEQLNVVEDFIVSKGYERSSSQTGKLTKCETGFSLMSNPDSQWKPFACSPDMPNHHCYSREANPCISKADPSKTGMPLEETGVSETFGGSSSDRLRFLINTNTSQTVPIVFHDQKISIQGFEVSKYYNVALGTTQAESEIVFPHGATVIKADGSKVDLESYFNDFMKPECRDFHFHFDTLSYQVDSKGNAIPKPVVAKAVGVPVIASQLSLQTQQLQQKPASSGAKVVK